MSLGMCTMMREDMWLGMCMRGHVVGYVYERGYVIGYVYEKTCDWAHNCLYLSMYCRVCSNSGELSKKEWEISTRKSIYTALLCINLYNIM